MDLEHIVVPDHVASWIGIIFILLLWKLGGIWLTEFIRTRQFRRRIGNRNGDDVRIPHGMTLEWYDRLIDAMDRNASINQQVATALTRILSSQDMLMENSRLSQIQQQEILELLKPERA